MTQTAAVRLTDDISQVDYTPTTAKTAGDVVLIDSIPGICTADIAANALGALALAGVFSVPKDTATFTVGESVYWHTAGDPVTGTAGTGAANDTASGGYLMGICLEAAATGDDMVKVALTAAQRSATIAGAVVATSITGDSATLPIAGVAGSSGAGGTVDIVGGAGDTGAGGQASLTGGLGSAAVGGAAVITGGVGGTTSAGGEVSMTGGLGTGAAGGAATVAGGVGGTAAAGGATTVAGGAGTTSGNGGALSLASGAGGTSGAGGAVTITAGAGGSTSGNNGTVAIAGGSASGTPNTIGGVASITGGAGKGTAAGGAVSVVGGAGGGTSGTGGQANLTGGAGTAGNANGGAVAITGGAPHNTGTAGAVSVDAGAAGAGTGAAVTIGATNAASVTIGRSAGTIAIAGTPTFAISPRLPVAAKTATGSTQAHALAAPTAVLAEGINIVAAADDATGVALPAAVAGAIVIVKSTAAGKNLVIWPNTDDAINAGAGNAKYDQAADAGMTMLVAADSTTWYTLPLVTS